MYSTHVNNTEVSTKLSYRQFYKLSKAHHPDRNPTDPEAPKRFVKVSEAYAVLGTPAKRQQYDHDVIGTSHSSGDGHPHEHARQGSYHSSGPVGGRPASGLSRRRTQFRGPPASFYRNGGWGEHAKKRQAAQESGAPGEEAPKRDESEMGGGMGTGQAPFGHVRDVPHFDREGHTRTHEVYDRRRQARESGDNDRNPMPDAGGMMANFLMISAVISIGVVLPSLLFEGPFTRRKHEKTEK